MYRITLIHLALANVLLKTLQIDTSHSIKGDILIDFVEKKDVLLILKTDHQVAFIVSYEIVSTEDVDVLEHDSQNKKKLYYDLQSIQAKSLTQMIEIPLLDQQLYFYIHTHSHLIGTLELYMKEQSKCVNNCQGFSGQQQSICDNRQCVCGFEYFGDYCQLKRHKINKNQPFEMEISTQWTYLAFQVEQNAIFRLKSNSSAVYMAIGEGGPHGTKLPLYEQVLESVEVSLRENLDRLKNKGQTILYIGLLSDNSQTIVVEIESITYVSFWQGNYVFIIFTVANIFLMISCYGLTSLCKPKQRSTTPMRTRSRPKLESPRQFAGSFFDKYFDKFEHPDLTSMIPSLSTQSQCCICLEILEQKPVTVTPCMHVFHHVCLKEWMMKSLKCPHCRFKMSHQSISKQTWITLNEPKNLDSTCIEQTEIKMMA